MAIFIRDSSNWKSVNKLFINLGSAGWKQVQKGFVNIGSGIWKTFFSSGVIPSIAQQVTISQATGATGLITLTGTNYHWTNFNTGIYEFQVSTNSTNWTTINSGSILNPATGSSNTKTYLIKQSDLTANASNDFRFVVTVTSSSNNTASSTSSSTTVEMPSNITDLTATASTTSGSVNLLWTASQNSNRQMVQFKPDGGDWSTFAGVSGTATSTTVTGLNIGGILYYFRILPYTGSSNNYGYYGNFSNEATATTMAAATYTFNFGKVLQISTNGYINLSEQINPNHIYVAATVGKVLSYLNADLIQDYISYASSGDTFYIYWQGHRFNSSNMSEIRVEIQLTDYSQDANVHYTFTTDISPRNSNTIIGSGTKIGYAVNGSYDGYSSTTDNILNDQQIIINMGTSGVLAPQPSGSWFTPKGGSWGGWITFFNTDGITQGTIDDGYYQITTAAGQSPSAPSVSSSNVGSTTAKVSWTAPSNIGGSKIKNYEYSIDNQATWNDVSTNTSVDLTGLTVNNTYTVYVRANNYFFTGTNYGSVSFTTTASAPENFTTISFTKAKPSSGSGGVTRSTTLSWNASNNATKYKVQYQGSTDGSTWTTVQTFSASPDITTTTNTRSWSSPQGASDLPYYDFMRASIQASNTDSTVVKYSDSTSDPSVVTYIEASGSAPGNPSFGTISKTSSSASIPITINSNEGSNYVTILQYKYRTSGSSYPTDWSSVSVFNSAATISLSGLSSNTTYDVVIRSKNLDNLYSSEVSTSFTTSAAFVTPTVGAIGWSAATNFGRYNVSNVRQGVNWCWNHPSTSGSVDTSYGGGTGIVSYDWEIYTVSSGGSPLNSGTKSYNALPASLFLVSSPPGTTSTASNSSTGPFNHKMGSNADTAYTTSARYGRVRCMVRGTDGNNYYGAWTARI